MMGNLQKVIYIKNKIKEHELLLNSIMPDAILEALDLLNSEDSNLNNQVIFRCKLGKIVLVNRKRFVPLKESSALSRIDELIKFHQTMLAGSHREELLKINAEIEALEAKIKKLKIEQDKLLSNSSITNLKTEFIKVQEAESYIEPTLSIYLK